MAPTITSISPSSGDLAADEFAARWVVITFTVTMDDPADVPTLWTTWGDPVYDTWLIYDGSAFTPPFMGRSKVTDQGGGVFDFEIRPNGGWLTGFDLTVGLAEAPASDGELSYTLPARSEVEPPALSPANAVLGRDISLEGGTTHVTPQGDYLLVDGERNLRQSLLHRIAISAEEWRIKQDYGAGVADFVQGVLDQASRSELEQLITEQVMRDRRVLAVEEVAIEADLANEVTKIQLVAQTRSGKVTIEGEIS